MSIKAIAKTDLLQTGRSWHLLGLGAAVVFFFAGASAVFVALGRLPGVEHGSVGFTGALVIPVGLLFPLVGVLIGYRAIIGERTSGTIRILLSLPHSRVEVVLGKLLSRVALVLVTVVPGATVGYLSLSLFGDSVGGLEYATVIVLAMLLQATFVSISVGLSAGIGSETVVAAVGLGSIVLFTALWHFVVRAIEVLLLTLGVEAFVRSVTQFLYALNPVLAFSRLASRVVGTKSQIELIWGEWWFAVLVLLWWCTVSILVGTWRFERAELS